MRHFRDAIKGLPHAEERSQGTSRSRHAMRPPVSLLPAIHLCLLESLQDSETSFEGGGEARRVLLSQSPKSVDRLVARRQRARVVAGITQTEREVVEADRQIGGKPPRVALRQLAIGVDRLATRHRSSRGV